MCLTPEQKTYLFLSLSGILLVLIVMFIAVPTVRQIYTIGGDIERLRGLLEERYTRAKRQHRTSLKLPEIRNYVNRWDNALLTPKGELQFIRFVEGLAAEQGLAATLKPTPIAGAAPFLQKGFQIEMQLSGAFEHMVNFISALEQSDYYAVLHKVELQRSGSPTDEVSPHLFAHIISTVYVQ